jgi:DNA polymerase III epsilon subunit family exonuclease
MRTLVFDTETTGLIKNMLPPLDRQPHIIEFFALSLDSAGNELEKFHYLFNPGVKFEEKITQITGITPDMLKNEKSFSVIAQHILELIEVHDEVVAHNLSFDKAMIDVEMKRCGKKVKWPSLICTIEATEYIKGYRLNLNALHEMLFDVEFKDAHRAENDVRALARCFNELRKMGVV